MFDSRIRAALGASAALVGTAALALLAAPATAQAPGQPSAFIQVKCNRDCLIGFARDYVAALEKRDPSLVKLAPNVRFAENNVEMPVSNHGLWGTIDAVRPGAMEVADEETANAAWFGIVEEHGNPAYLALRIAVANGAITEIETIVNRRPDMPKPFGNPDTVSHDPAFNEVLPAAQRRSRERLVAVADGYFNTVELNDGDIFTQFHADCRRLENGVATAAATAPPAGGAGPGAAPGAGARGAPPPGTGARGGPPPQTGARGGPPGAGRGAEGIPGAGRGGNAANIAAGCESQLRLGIYRINKRIRERRYPIIDVERGVIVASGFFDHANTFDRYTLTDGREMTTVLKWPNSISLLEAFKVVDGKILSIEAVFTYVPYFMHSPFTRPNLDWQTR